MDNWALLSSNTQANCSLIRGTPKSLWAHGNPELNTGMNREMRNDYIRTTHMTASLAASALMGKEIVYSLRENKGKKIIIYPIIIDGVDAITAWKAADNVSITVTTFTGLSPVAGITPLIVLIGFISSAVITGFMGVKTIKGGGDGGKIDAGGLIMQGIGMIFISVGLIIFPVVMDGVRAAQVDIAASSGTFTGLTQILSVTPLIVLVAFISAAVITTYFGAKQTMGKGKKKS